MVSNISIDVQKTLGPLLNFQTAENACIELDTKTNLLARLEHHRKLQQAISQEIESHSALVRYKLNSFLSLHTLPAEIFREILVHALHAESGGTSNTWKYIHKLASVSKYWFEMVTGEPRLWTKITSADPPMVTGTKLRNSKGAELDVELDLAVGVPMIMADTEEEWSTNLVSGESRRWRSLAFRCTTCPRWVSRALNGSAPALRDLCARIPWGWTGDPEPRINLGDEGETLRRLRLEVIALGWDSQRLANLKYLSLARISTYAPSLTQLRRILLSSPALESLGLVHLPCHTDQIDNTTIHLPYLQAFKLEAMPQAVSSNLVSSIHASQNCGILVHPLEAAGFAEPSFQAALARWVRAPFRSTGSIFLAVDGNMDEVTIRTSPSPHSEVWRPETWPDTGETGAFLAVRLKGSIGPIHQVVDILKASNTPAIVHLDVRWFGVEEGRRFPMEILDDLKGLQQMTVLGPVDVNAVMEYLARPTPSPENGRMAWPCPNLSVLRIGSAQPSEIAKLLQIRRAHCGEMTVDCLLGTP